MRRLWKKYQEVVVALCCMVVLCGLLAVSSTSAIYAFAVGEDLTVNVRHIYPAAQNSAAISNVADGSQINPRDWRQLTYGNANYVLSKLTVERLAVTPVDPPIDPPVDPPIDPPVDPPVDHQYLVTFDANGGISVPETQQVKSGQKLNKPADPIKDGYTFAGWYADEDLSGDPWDFDSDTVTGGMILYAKWVAEIVDYTVTFDANGGSPTPAPQIIAHGQKVSEPTDPVKGGYAFAGWYAAEDFSGDLWDFDNDVVTDDMFLFAKWEVETIYYTVSYNANGGSPTPAPQIIAHGQTVIKPAAPVKGGYAFAGWYAAEDLSGDLWDFDSDTVTGDMTLFAKWVEEIVYYTVTFETNGGTPIPDPQIIAHGGKVLRPVDPIKEDFMFVDWYPTPQTSGTPWIFGLHTVTEDITLYARWTLPGRSPVIQNQNLNSVEVVEAETSHSNIIENQNLNSVEVVEAETSHSNIIENQSLNSMEEPEEEISPNNAWDAEQELEQAELIEQSSPDSPYLAPADWETVLTWERGQPTNVTVGFEAGYEYRVTYWYEAASTGGGRDSGGGGGGSTTTTRTSVTPEPQPQVNTAPEVELSDNGNFEQIGEDGVPLGRYTLADDGETWIFTPDVPMGNLPQTGASSALTPSVLLLLGLLALASGLYLRLRKNQL